LMRAETEARTHSEKAMKEAEGRAEAASLALAEAERRKAEAEGKAQSAEENARAIEGLIDEAESIANAARDRYKNAEVRMQQEIQLRNEAEARLKDLENELGTLLASDNWNKIEPRSDVDLSDEAALHLKSQVESEQKVRAAAEEARTAAEVRVRQLEEELFKYEEKYRQVEEKHRQAEAGFKKILRKQEAELRSLSEQVTRANSTTTDLTVIKSSGKNDAQTAIASMNKNAQLKLVSYGFVIGVLSIGVLFLIYQLYVQYFS
jgi:chromosome segregation ATPase